MWSVDLPKKHQKKRHLCFERNFRKPDGGGRRGGGGLQARSERAGEWWGLPTLTNDPNPILSSNSGTDEDKKNLLKPALFGLPEECPVNFLASLL